jgi:hypothetical protein
MRTRASRLRRFPLDHPDFLSQAMPGGKIGRRAALLPHAHTFGANFVGPAEI